MAPVSLGMLLAVTALCGPSPAPAEAPLPPVPTTFEALWRDVDPRREPLEARIVREWTAEGLVLRYVTYTVGEFRGVKARMAGYYGFPKGQANLPGLLHLHGGGQRAFLAEVKYYASRGYACLSINWGGRPMEDARPAEPNTDWGKVDPTQQNVPGYFNFAPGPKYLDPQPSPRNNNWYLLTLAGRRGLTFLERQNEVDPKRLGVYGHSMGGNLTVYVAGTDSRVKAAAPSVGGTGFGTCPWPLLPAYRPRQYGEHTDLFRRTLAFEAYAPHVRAPLLYLGASNDFHGLMDDMYRTAALTTHAPVQFSVTPHMNHRFTPDFDVTRPLWLDQHLKGGPALAQTPRTELRLKTDDHTPRLVVRPDRPRQATAVCVYYSVDPDPRARFWRSAEARADGKPDDWVAALKLTDTTRPLFAYASVYYPLPKPSKIVHGQADRCAVSSLLHTATPAQLAEAGVRAEPQGPGPKPALVIDDFSHGWRDWYVLEPGNPHHWQYWTRKVTDPLWRGPKGAKLAVTAASAKDNDLIVVLEENAWRSYRGKHRTYAAVVRLKGGDKAQTVLLGLQDFREVSDDKPPASWDELDELGLKSYHTVRPRQGVLERTLGTTWQGPGPQFRQIAWRVGE